MAGAQVVRQLGVGGECLSVEPDGGRVFFATQLAQTSESDALRVVPDLEGTFLAMNGDVLTNLNYRALFDYHRDRDALLTIAMHRKHVHIDLGVIENSDGFVSAYREKPVLNYEVSMGVYIYDARALEYLPEGQCQFPDLVQRLLAADQVVAAFPAYDAEWFDIGTFGELERATARLEERPDLFRAPDVHAGM